MSAPKLLKQASFSSRDTVPNPVGASRTAISQFADAAAKTSSMASPRQEEEEEDDASQYRNSNEVPDSGPAANLGPVTDRRETTLHHGGEWQQPRTSSHSAAGNVPPSWANLDEMAAVSPVKNLEDAPAHLGASLQEARSLEREYLEEACQPSRNSSTEREPTRFATQLYTHSHLVLFSLLGTLARKGLAVLTAYPGRPIAFDTIWVNFAGCLVMGFLVEDRMLFRHEWGSPTYHEQIMREKQRQRDEESGISSDQDPIDLGAAKKTFISTKKGIPLYIGLTTGFCGSFTTFSEFILDVFLALSNELRPPDASENMHRNGGYSFMALVGVIIATVGLSVSGLMVGAHLAVSLEGLMPSLPYMLTRRFFDRLVVFLGWGSWSGAIALCVFPPHDFWRGHVAFALVFAPLGVFARFYLALFLNGRNPSFPVGTFVANIFASVILASAWDMGHAAVGGVVGCQVLQGIQDGFCGCLSTVSTWVVELTSLRRKHSYLYGSSSVVVSLAVVVVIAGSQYWASGARVLVCSTWEF